MFQLSLISTIFLLSSFIVATEAIKCNDGKGLATKPVDCGEDVKQCFSFMFDFSAIKETNLTATSINSSTFRCDAAASKCKDLERFNNMNAVQYFKTENISYEEEFGVTMKDWDKKVDFVKAALALAAHPKNADTKKNFAIAMFQKAKIRMRCCSTDLCNTLSAA